MDKTKVKIESYLSTIRVESEEERQKIIEFCVEKGRNIVFPKKKAYATELPTITFEEFTNWYKEASYGDIIRLESGIIGIVKEVAEENITLYTYLSPDGTFSTRETDIPYESYREATIEEMQTVQVELSKNNLQWNKTSNILTKKIYPAENEHIRLTVLGNKVGYGVFREIKENHLIMYCVIMENEPIKYSLYEDLGDYRLYQFEKVTENERNLFREELAKEEKEWDGFKKRIVHLKYRAPRGGVYYYITDKFDVAAALDERPRDERRFQSGNYFRDKVDAENLLEEMNSWSKEYFKKWTPKSKKTKQEK